MQLNLVERSVKSASALPPLPSTFRNFPAIFFKQDYALYPLRKRHCIFKNVLLKYAYIWSYTSLLYILPKFGKILIGL